MGSRTLRLGTWSAFGLLALASCSLDDRRLNYESRALQVAGASSGGGSGAGAGAAGAPSNGEAGMPSAGADGSVDPGSGDAGSPSAVDANAGGAGASGLGGTGANAGAAGNASNSGGTLSAGTGGTAAAGAGGSGAGAGAGPVFACGDLNHDLVDDCTQTLVQNSRFDTSIAHWDAESSMTETWGSVNASGAPGSGSISVNHTGPGSTMIGARQCIPVTPNASYDIAARVQVGAGQTGTAGINVYFYDDGACEGNFVLPGNTPIEGGVAGAWIVLATDAPLWIPGTAHSMYVRLVANKPPFQTTPLTVLIDDVLVAKRAMP